MQIIDVMIKHTADEIEDMVNIDLKVDRGLGKGLGMG